MVSEPQEKVLDLRSVFGLQATVTTPSEATGAPMSKWTSWPSPAARP